MPPIAVTRDQINKLTGKLPADHAMKEWGEIVKAAGPIGQTLYIQPETFIAIGGDIEKLQRQHGSTVDTGSPAPKGAGNRETDRTGPPKS